MENLPYVLFIIEATLEPILLWSSKGKTLRGFASNFLMLLLAFSHSAILLNNLNVYSAVFALVGVFRAVNIMRYGLGRMNADYLRISAFRSSWRLIILQLASTGIAYSLATSLGSLTLASVAIALFSAVVFLQTARRMARFELASIPRPQATKELPVVSVCIPARNETEDLEDCIKTVLASDYPKLEVLVYDDCSQDRTPAVIKEYAHAGVRFIAGSEPDPSWLAKNAAYQTLTEETSGDYLLFCGVDLRFEASAISSMIAIMQKRSLNMISVLPRRDRGMRYALFFQSARYLWELALPRQILHRPPALSSCWVAKKSLLKKNGFKAVTRSTMPERYFAWKADRANAYGFLSARNLDLIHSHKTLEEQRLTAMRLRYPQLRKRPENAALYTLLALAIVLLPFVSIVGVVLGKLPVSLMSLAIASIVLLNMTNGLITAVVSQKHVWISVLIFPLIVFADIGSLLVSMWKYEFSSIDWKGRNVCLPVMHVVPHLPKTQ